MANFLKLFTTYNSYSQHTSNVPENGRPETCYCRDGRLVSYYPIIVNILCDNSITAESYQFSALVKGRIKSNITYTIESGNQYASVTSSSQLTINSNANNSPIVVAAKWGVSVTRKQITVTYLSGASVESETEIIENQDGTTTEQTTIITNNPDGSTSTETNTSNYSEDGNITSQTTSEVIENADGSSESQSTTTNYDENGDVESSSQTTVETQSDGSFNGRTENYDAEGNMTDAENQIGDSSGNVDTQTVEYDENGDATVTGYEIDTSGNTGGTGKVITTEEVNTEYYAFDTTSAFECMIHFKFVPTGQVNQATILNAKRADPEPWYGFDLRRNSSSNNIQYGAQFDSTNSRANITRPSNDTYKIKVTYNPTVPNGQTTFQFYDMLNNKSLFTSTKRFPNLEELKYLNITIGCALTADGQPQRRANVTVYEFYVRRLE